MVKKKMPGALILPPYSPTNQTPGTFSAVTIRGGVGVAMDN